MFFGSIRIMFTLPDRQIAAFFIQICMVIFVVFVTLVVAKVNNLPGKFDSSRCADKHVDPHVAYKDQMALAALAKNVAKQA